MFDQFPKMRPALPPELAALHAACYQANREGATPASALSLRMESWLHRQVAHDVTADRSPKATLEIGAGTLNQLHHEPAVGPYDIVEPNTARYTGSRELARVRQIYGDIGNVPRGTRYDRVTSIATFEHLTDLPRVAATAGLLLAPGGVLRVAIPSEGTPLWALGWQLTTGLEFRLRHGLDYGLLMRHEHINTAREIEEVLTYFFARLECRVLGVSRYLSVYQFFACGGPDLRRCAEFSQ